MVIRIYARLIALLSSPVARRLIVSSPSVTSTVLRAASFADAFNTQKDSKDDLGLNAVGG